MHIGAVFSLKIFPGALTALTGSKWGLWQHLLWVFSLHIDDLSSCHISCLHIDYAADSNYKRRHQIMFFFSKSILLFPVLSMKTNLNSLSKCRKLSSNASRLPTFPSIHRSSMSHHYRDGCWFLVVCQSLLGEENACKVLRVTLH